MVYVRVPSEGIQVACAMRSLMQAAIHAGKLVQGETKPIERYVIAPGCFLILAFIAVGVLA